MSQFEQPTADGEEHHSQKDQYCYICEDGGNIIECTLCSKACCYNVIGQRVESAVGEPDACVSIPESMAHGKDIPFPCPSCVAERGYGSIGYFINQGARATMRVSTRTSLVLIIYHLYSYKAIAMALADQIVSALSAFYVTVACQTRLIHRGFTTEEANLMFDEIPGDAPYHLAVIFLTEGDPRGGWWHTSAYGNMKDSQISEADFLTTCLQSLGKMAEGAQTSRLFGVVCGLTLKAEGSIERIKLYLESTKFRSLVMPSACSMLMCDYVPIFPEIFINLYYFGSALEPALLRVWCKSKETRTHTGLVIMERLDQGSAMNVKLALYAPRSGRPFGVPLPLVYTVCGCPPGQGDWVFKKERDNHPETIFIYRSSCCGVELQVGIYPDGRVEQIGHEVKYIVEPWNPTKRRFTFDETNNVRMKTFPPSSDGKGILVDLTGMWTRSGKKAWKRKVKMGLLSS